MSWAFFVSVTAEGGTSCFGARVSAISVWRKRGLGCHPKLFFIWSKSRATRSKSQRESPPRFQKRYAKMEVKLCKILGRMGIYDDHY